MAIQHTSEKNTTMGIVGEIQRGAAQGILSSADLSSLSAAKTAVDADVAKLHQSERLAGVGVKAALDIVDNYVAGITTGTDVTDVDVLHSNPSPKGRKVRF